MNKRVQILTEGSGEYRSLPNISPQLRTLTGNIILKPLHVAVSPNAPSKQIARACVSRIKIAQAKGADLIVLLLDREDQQACPGKIADELASQITKTVAGVEVKVVLKDRMFENWLIADIEAVASLTGRFKISGSVKRKVQPNKADRCDALGILKAAAKSNDYHKIDDAHKITAVMSLTRAAQNSRSLRHFLHVLGDPSYVSGCS